MGFTTGRGKRYTEKSKITKSAAAIKATRADNLFFTALLLFTLTYTNNNAPSKMFITSVHEASIHKEKRTLQNRIY